MKTISHYCIVSEIAITDVENIVSELMGGGWQPLYALTVNSLPGNELGIQKVIFTQTMVKYTNGNKD